MISKYKWYIIGGVIIAVGVFFAYKKGWFTKGNKPALNANKGDESAMAGADVVAEEYAYEN